MVNGFKRWRMSFDIADLRSQFPILERTIGEKSLVYLDSAASNLKPYRVAERIRNHYLNEASNVHRGVHTLSDEATTAFERSREKVREFLNISSSDEVIFTKGTTDSINLIASSGEGFLFKSGDRILLTEMEHHSNIVPWQIAAERIGAKVIATKILESGDIDLNDFEAKLKEGVSLVSFTQVSNSLGTVNQVKELVELSHKYGAKTVIDGAQAVAHMDVNIKELNCDFYAFSGHKIFGPTGIGVLFGKKDLLEVLPPYQGGGAMIDSVTIDKTTYADLPHKFEAGTPHIAGVLGLCEAIEFVEDLGIENIKAHEDNLVNLAVSRLSEIERVKIIGHPNRRSSIVSFVIEGCHHQDVGSILNNCGVAVRTGHHCTQPLMNRFGITGTIRASFSVFNQESDIDQLTSSLQKSIDLLD